MTDDDHAADPVRRIISSLFQFQRLTAVSITIQVGQRIHSLEVSTFAMLEYLADSGPQKLGLIAQELKVAQSTITRRVQVLESLGLVQKDTDSADRRSVLARITPLGVKALAGEHEYRERRLSEDIADWSQEERAEFARQWERLNVAIVARRTVGGADARL